MVIKMTEENEKQDTKKIKCCIEDDDDEKDVEELERLLTVVSEKVPALLNALTDVLYGKEQSKKYAEAVATFYKALVSAGMDKREAYELTSQYMANLNIAGAIEKFFKAKKGSDIGELLEEEELGEEIKREVKAKVKEKVEKELKKHLEEEEQKQE